MKAKRPKTAGYLMPKNRKPPNELENNSEDLDDNYFSSEKKKPK